MDNEEQDNDHDTSRNLLDSFNSEGKLNFVAFIKENYLYEFHINDTDLEIKCNYSDGEIYLPECSNSRSNLKIISMNIQSLNSTL